MQKRAATIAFHHSIVKYCRHQDQVLKLATLGVRESKFAEFEGVEDATSWTRNTKISILNHV